ncbi:MAG: hypothetical protein V4714_19170, partial [Bacteroidota bacterium]
MKAILYFFSTGVQKSISGLVCLSLFLMAGCSKEITETEANLPALAPANLETNGGDWKTVILANSAEI